ncbi:hypothetical protein M9Y10_018335 [Tritrichomonas musculus]|uniref:Ras family protein n=1 Tax=Tritrichomonas musculus TaxID=1915356 RepID=A0ABR2GML3_9EUKA
MEYLKKMKAIQDSILEYLDNEDNNEQYFDDLRSLLNFQQSQFDIHELKSILCLISNISKYHHRKSFFFDKIKQIILLLKKEVKQAFSNADIFNIFKDSNRVLLLLFDEDILTLDSNLSTTIDKNYFQPEINKLNPDSSPIELPEFFYEKRLQGENDSYLCELVRNDNIKDFIIHYNKQEISLSMTIQSSIYETNSFLINQNPTLIEYSAFFGSIQILRFLYQNQVELTSSLWIYSIHGHNPEIIHFLEENQIQPSDGTYQEYNIDIYNSLLKEAGIEIGPKCFKNCQKLKSFSFPESATTIGDYAFSKCFKLEKINIPSSVTTIGSHCFDSCFSLIDIDIPSITSINEYTFYCCEKMTKIDLPSSLTIISNHSFEGCTNLIEITIPPSVTSIGQYSFNNCSSLRKINLPRSITSIENYLFNECKSLTKICIPQSVVSIGEYSFNKCIKLKTIDIPSSVKTIGKNAFNSCSSLEKMIIPQSVTTIGDYFISECYSLSIIIIPSSVTNIGKLSFYNFELLKEFIIPSSSEIIDENEFNGCTSLVKVEIPSSIKRINRCAFKNCSSLKEIIIPPSVISIDFKVFEGCTSLIKVQIPPTLESIGYDAFDECTSLKKIEIHQDSDNSAQNIKIVTENASPKKILIVGDIMVGKTCILHRYVENAYDGSFPATIHCAFKNKIVNIENDEIKLQIWDTPGSKRFRILIETLYRGACGLIVVFDLTQPDTLESIDEYFSYIKDENMVTVLLGNKCDIEHKVSDEDIKFIENKYNTKYFEVSAEYGDNIEDAFNYLANQLYEEIREKKSRIRQLINNDDIDEKQNKCIIF